jgi:hypothetical protein
LALSLTVSITRHHGNSKNLILFFANVVHVLHVNVMWKTERTNKASEVFGNNTISKAKQFKFHNKNYI